MVLVSFWRPSLVNPANVLLISLAMTDLGSGLITAPLFFISNIAKLTEDEGLYCRVTPVYLFVATCLSGISLLTLTAISVVRYTALHVHLRYNEVVTMRRVCVAIVWMWLFIIGLVAADVWCDPGGISDPHPAVPSGYRLLPHQNPLGRPSAPGSDQRPDTGIDWTATRRECVRHEGVQKVLRGHACNLLHVSPTFHPTRGCQFDIAFAHGAAVPVYAAIDLAEVLLHTNSALNPLLYCWRSQAIRSAVKETAQKLFCRSATLSE